MTYQTKLHPWCIVRKLTEQHQIIVDRFRHYQDADARVKILRRVTPNTAFVVLFDPAEPEPSLNSAG